MKKNKNKSNFKKKTSKKKNNKKGLQTLERKIFRLFAENPSASFGYNAIHEQVGKGQLTKGKVVELIDKLWESGKIVPSKGNRFTLGEIRGSLKNGGKAKKKNKSKSKNKTFNKSSKTIVGTVDMTSSGAAFIICEQLEKDVYVPSHKVNRAFDGDIVRISFSKGGRRGRIEGEVVEILERKQTTFVGIIKISSKFAFLIPDKKMAYDLYIPLSKTQGAKDGEKVIVEFVDWPERRKSPIGEVKKVLGKVGENDVEMMAILAEKGFELEFSEAALKEGEALSMKIEDAEIAKRRDFRNITTFTIDPYDAKDFDDALSIQKLENGNWEIGIHIADVSHYMKPNSEMDKEAYERATSVYLVDRVIPMCPENLSNMVCSLRPKEEKLCFSAVFELTAAANVVNEWFGKTVIFSDRRFNYTEAQMVLETGEGDFAEEIQVLDDLAKKLRQERFKKGSINFGSEEVKFRLDENGKPIDVYVKEIKDSNRLIEDFMLLANRKVAAFINEKNENVPFVNRIHELPNIDKLVEFKRLAANFGYQLQIDTPTQISDSLNKLLAEVQGKPEQRMLESLAIRSMSKAVYSTKNEGHYGLGFKNYAHFTSPIRRYPDVMVHRILFQYLTDKSKINYKARGLEEQCEHCSIMEKRAMQAERDSTKYKQVEYMSERIGEEFYGVISGVVNFGFFVEIEGNKCEGLVRTDSLHGVFQFDEANHRLISPYSDRKFQLGQRVKVLIKATDLMMKTIDLTVLEGEIED
ncbi:MAG: ribonuclease R [Chitinophagales bacterium]